VPAAVTSAIGEAGLRAVAFGIALAAVLALFVVAAVRRKAPGAAPL
jgi:hypothetical protein